MRTLALLTLLLWLRGICDAQSQNSQVPQDPCATTERAQASQRAPSSSDDDRTIVVQVALSKSGRVRDTRVLSGPPALRDAAITTLKAQSFTVQQKSADLRNIKLAVTFAGDSTIATDISQMVSVVVQAGGPLAGIRQVVIPGAPGCVHVSPTMVRLRPEFMQRQVAGVPLLYPPEAKADHVEGTVVLRIHVDQAGNVVAAAKLSGPDVLVPAAIEAAKRFKYQPYLLNGMPIAVETTVDVKFSLSDGGS